MKPARKIILKPLVTEKSTDLRVKEDKYAFEVDLKANKPEIKKAIEELFKVNVVEVHTMIVHGKVKRMGRFEGKRPNWKKAIVSLKKGEKIEFFETV
ncbi:MAG: 50S ribosomal protein L23 [candidate division Zixibacteria bacterium RBG_16_43_9]|nr:MAG: 50S ribosomal protein L23 [candidate division Zixibacteria bacterium RBG_16_43_9]